MNRTYLFNAGCVAVGFLLLGGSISRADVVVYKQSCGRYAYSDWNVTCKIDRNTFKAGSTGSWTDGLATLQSITVCASFGNRGGLNTPALIVHNDGNGEQSLPTNRFETVKFQGGLVAEKMAWAGTSPRHWPPSLRMQGELLYNGKRNSFAYAETVWDGQRMVGEIRATCSRLDDE